MFATTKSQQMLNASNAVVAFHGLEMAAEGIARNFLAIPSAVAKPTGLFAFLLYMCCMGLWSLRTTGMAETKARTEEIEELFAKQRSAKRLKMRKTHEGEEF